MYVGQHTSILQFNFHTHYAASKLFDYEILEKKIKKSKYFLMM